MNKTYNPKDIEQVIYSHWEKEGYFNPNNDPSKENYCIMLPPPNVTGNLHMGHAFQHTIMDIMIRYQRMKGKNTLWQAGTDHAGIATQMVIEHKIFSEEGKTRQDYGRDDFIKKIWQWIDKSSNTITNQMRRIGDSVHWKNNRFTMDKGLSNAVKEVFVRLYREGLIYRGKRLVNWDPKLRTVVSDLEVENRESNGLIWHLRYPLANSIKTKEGKNYLVVATTRPETMLGDVCVAVNPEDFRYKDLIGKYISLPLVKRYIPIIGDKYADMTKGTGCVKITPAHDFNDYIVAKRHNLNMISIFTFEGTIRSEGEIFNTNGELINSVSIIPKSLSGLNRFSARIAILEKFKRLGFLELIKPHHLVMPYGDRSGVLLEPMLTNQWYVRTKNLAKVAVDAVKSGDIQFIPKQYENIYFSWMHNIQDWCISRQIWWGHRIPAWYDNKGHIYVGRDEMEIRREHNLNNTIILYQDEDVLDTWFSSSLWTFSTLGWPENTKFLKEFHPTNLVVSGFDIIFFWIARMIMMTMHFLKDKSGKPQVPFKIVYITGLVYDNEAKKMSKSKGNVIDPLDIIDGISLSDLLKKRTRNMMQPHLSEKIQEKTKREFPNGIKSYGTDAMRFTLSSLTSTGRDINWSMKRLNGYRNFCNKLWNASRFVLINTEKQDCGFNNKEKLLSLADRWILTKLNQTIKNFCEALDDYRFDLASNIIYEFTWNQFCDWYLEFTKPIINYGNEIELRGTRNTLITVLETLLRLAHPVIPFITEIIWQKVQSIIGTSKKTIMLESFPTWNKSCIDLAAVTDLEWIKQMIISLRMIRIEMRIRQDTLLVLLIRRASMSARRRIHNNLNLIRAISSLESITFLPIDSKGPLSVIKLIDGAELLVPMSGLIEKKSELDRLKKEVLRIEGEIDRIKKKLSNECFISHAPGSVILKEQKKLDKYNQLKAKFSEQYLLISKKL